MLHNLKSWIKTDDSLTARMLRSTYFGMRNFQIPTIPVIHRCLYGLHKLITGFIEWFLRVAYWTPLFKSRLENASPHLYLYGGMPLVTGPLSIRIGKDCRISGVTTFSGRWSSAPKPSLVIGDNVGIGWQTTIAVGSRVVIGNNVRIASRAFIAGYPGHPLNAKDRAAGLPDTDDQVGDIILDDDVWLGAGVTILAGVHVGAGTIIASASVVTRDLPAHVLAAGVPAKVIRSIEPEDEPNILECVQ